MKIDIVSVDDWEALYIDGNKVLEGHILEVKDVLSVLGIECESKYLETPNVDGDWYFGNKLKNIVFEKY